MEPVIYWLFYEYEFQSDYIEGLLFFMSLTAWKMHWICSLNVLPRSSRVIHEPIILLCFWPHYSEFQLLANIVCKKINGSFDAYAESELRNW